MMARPRGKYRYRTQTHNTDWSEERMASHDRQNVGDLERMFSGILGGGLMITGLTRRSWAGAGMAMVGAVLMHRGISGYCAVFDALRVETNGQASPDSAGRRKVQSGQAEKIRRTIEINRSPSELYRFWRSFENLPRVMSHLQSVRVVNDRVSHWVVKTMAGAPSVEWDAEIINDLPDERIAWRSLEGADVDNAGSVEFEPTGDGQRTRVTVTLQYQPPGGRIGTAIAKLFGEDPDHKIARDLQRFKESMEAGAYAR